MKRIPGLACTVLLAAVLCCLAAAPPALPPAVEVRALVDQLGADEYSVRESASARLAALGRPVAAALREGARSPDLEVRRRSARLLARFDRPEVEPRLQALLDGEDVFTPPLPGWERFRELAGSDAAARLLYLDLYRADRTLLEQVQTAPARAAAGLVTRIGKLQQRQGRAPFQGPTRTDVGEMGAILLAHVAAPQSEPQHFYQVNGLFYQQSTRAAVRGDAAFRRLVTAFFTRKGLEPFALPTTVGLAVMLELTEFRAGTLEPLVLKRLDAVFTQKTDLAQLSQVAQSVAALNLKGRVSERAKFNTRMLARNLARELPSRLNDFASAHQLPSALRSLGMQDAIDEILGPALERAAEEMAGGKVDLQRLSQLHSVCQTAGFEGARRKLRVAACRAVAELTAGAATQQGVQQALGLTQTHGLEEAREGLVKPAARKVVLEALEQPDDLAKFSQACSLATQVRLDLTDDTLRPVLRRHLRRAAERPADLPTLQQLHQLAEQLKDGEGVTNHLRPAVARALVAASGKPIDNATLTQGLHLARQLKLEEGASLAVKGALARKLDPGTRAMAVLAVGALGTTAHARELGPLLADATAVGAISTNGAQISSQIRDVALGAQIHARGQKLSDFGFGQFATFGGGPFANSPASFGFPGEKEREEALARWKKWAAENKE